MASGGSLGHRDLRGVICGMSDQPLVTCLCLTRNRRQWLPLAIRYFQEQTYPNKEMLIIADGESVADLAVGDGVRLVEIEEGRKIGDKRNIGCSLAAGEFIATWDDDDFSAAGRLADQVGRLQETGKSVTAYSTMYFCNGNGEWWLFDSQKRGIGTSLFYRKSFWQDHQFLSKRQVGEDNDFVHVSMFHKQFETFDGGLLMAATIHEGNTSPRNLTPPQWKRVPEFAGVPGMEWPC